jgi:hypothetical protein
MPMMFPDFKNAHCFWMTVCGTVPKAGPELAKWMKGDNRKIATFKTERGEAHIRLIIGGDGESGNHVHFDVYCPEIVSKKAKGSSNSPSSPQVALPEIEESISRLFGQEIVASLKAGYKARIAELPETGIIRSFFFETKMGSVALKLEGARFSIEGAPIQNIFWGILPDGDIAVTLEADSIETIITEDYLTNANDTAEQAFNVFVLGKAQNATK